MQKSNKIGLFSASSFVVASMIGTGVFTSLGFQLLSIDSPVSILILWGLGGLTALCGALVYSELGAYMPRSGGEYHYLSVIYGPALGFLSGWVSMIVGFAAPVALACMALGKYVAAIFPTLNPLTFPITVLTIITILHSFSTHFGARLQNVLTLVKILVILAFIAAGFLFGHNEFEHVDILGQWSVKEIWSPGFAVALVWVCYSYSGWNAAAYIGNDIESPSKNIPKALLISTFFVTLIYILINYIFLRSTPKEDMTGVVEVGIVCAHHIFGDSMGNFMGLIIAGILVSSISSMVFIGPRVAGVIGEDHKIFSFLSHKTSRGCPIAALWMQYLLSLSLILTDSFSLVTEYTGILLSFFCLVTVFGIFLHRRRNGKQGNSYKVFAYPLPPIIFCFIMAWSIIYLVYVDFHSTFVDGTQSFMWMTVMSLATIAIGYIVYLINKLIK